MGLAGICAEIRVKIVVYNALCGFQLDLKIIIYELEHHISIINFNFHLILN